MGVAGGTDRTGLKRDGLPRGRTLRWQGPGSPLADKWRRRSRRWLAKTLGLAGLLCLFSPLVGAWAGGYQEELGGRAEAKREPSAATKPAVKVESVDLIAQDGFPLRATWYEGHLGKSSSPLLLLHDLGGSRQDFVKIATYFSENGHCVLVPDLRGHGESRSDAAGRPYQPRRHGPAEAMALQADIEACKKFLIQKNDAEVCNIELMAIIAAGASGIPALQWSVVDWSYLPGAVKQGQDVKAVVLLSPPRTHQAWQMAPVLRAPLIAGQGHPQPLELMFVVGDKSDVSRDVRSMYQQLAGLRGRRDEPDDWAKHHVYLLTTETDDRGVDLVLNNPRTVPDHLFDFLEQRVFHRAEEYGHHKRSKSNLTPVVPLEDGGL